MITQSSFAQPIPSEVLTQALATTLVDNFNPPNEPEQPKKKVLPRPKPIEKKDCEKMVSPDEIVSLFVDDFIIPFKKKVEQINEKNPELDLKFDPSIKLVRDDDGFLNLEFNDVPTACINMLEGKSHKESNEYYLAQLGIIDNCGDSGSNNVDYSVLSGNCTFSYDGADEPFKIKKFDIEENPQSALKKCFNHFQTIDNKFFQDLFKGSGKKKKESMNRYVLERDRYLGKKSIRLGDYPYDKHNEFLYQAKKGTKSCENKTEILTFGAKNSPYIKFEDYFRNVFNCMRRPIDDGPTLGLVSDLSNIVLKIEGDDKSTLRDVDGNRPSVLAKLKSIPSVSCDLNDPTYPGIDGIRDRDVFAQDEGGDYDKVVDGIIQNAQKRYQVALKAKKLLESSDRKKRSDGEKLFAKLQKEMKGKYWNEVDGKRFDNLDKIKSLAKVEAFAQNATPEKLEKGKKLHEAWARLKLILDTESDGSNFRSKYEEYFDNKAEFHQCESAFNYTHCIVNKKQTEDLLDYLKDHNDFDEDDAEKLEYLGVSEDDIDDIPANKLFIDDKELLGLQRTSEFHPKHIDMRIKILERRLDEFGSIKSKQACERNENKGKFSEADEEKFYAVINEKMDADLTETEVSDVTTTTNPWLNAFRSNPFGAGAGDLNPMLNYYGQNFEALNSRLNYLSTQPYYTLGQGFQQWGDLYSNTFSQFSQYNDSMWSSFLNSGIFSQGYNNYTPSSMYYDPSMYNTGNSNYLNYTPINYP